MEKKIRSPKSKGVARVPVVMQMENMECGAACLAMVLAYYRKWAPLSQLRKLCGISRDGAKMSTVAKTARMLGLKALGTDTIWKRFLRRPRIRVSSIGALPILWCSVGAEAIPYISTIRASEA